MTKFICLHCGHHFEGGEIVAKHYDRATGTWDAEECPECGSEDFEEAGHCIKCDGYFPLDDSNNPENYMVGSICLDCLKKSVNRANAIQYAIDRDFDADEPADIREDRLERYCFEDIYDYSEWLEDHYDAE